MVDAGRAFRYARGAMWHLEVALPQLEAAVSGAPRASELVGAAASHIRSAAMDAASSGRSNDAFQAALGALHLRLQHENPVQLRSAVSAIRDARLGAASLLDEIAPTLDSTQELLPLAPAASASSDELMLIERAVDARRFRHVSDQQRALVTRILRDGVIEDQPLRWVGGYGNGNGAMPMVRVQHPDSPHLTLTAVHRPPTAQAAQEEFFTELAARADIDDYFAPAVRRSDGSALVLAVPGSASWDQAVHSGDDVESVMRSWYQKRFGALSERELDRVARSDFDRVRSLDYITAQPDRNAGGLLVDRESGVVSYIDNGLAGRGETGDVLRPGLKSHFVGGEPGRVELSGDAARAVDELLDDEALVSAHRVLGRGPDGVLPDGHAKALAEDASAAFLDAMRTRRDQVVRGSFEYQPIVLDANPLTAMDDLRTLTTQGR